MDNFQVAIDGPAGSGKSSISKRVAQELNFVHIDTGAMYRAVTLEALKRKIDLSCEEEYSFLDDISVVYKDDVIYLNDENVSTEIRTDRVTKNTSLVSSLKCVREKMVHFQRISAKYGKILMDGRDIGTTVLPNADLKIFLTATVEERALRRSKEIVERGLVANYAQVLEDIKVRDYKDSHRTISPLKQAEDAVLIDTTMLSIEDVVNKIKCLVVERMNKK